MPDYLGKWLITRIRAKRCGRGELNSGAPVTLVSRPDGVRPCRENGLVQQPGLGDLGPTGLTGLIAQG